MKAILLHVFLFLELFSLLLDMYTHMRENHKISDFYSNHLVSNDNTLKDGVKRVISDLNIAPVSPFDFKKYHNNWKDYIKLFFSAWNLDCRHIGYDQLLFTYLWCRWQTFFCIWKHIGYAPEIIIENKIEFNSYRFISLIKFLPTGRHLKDSVYWVVYIFLNKCFYFPHF